MRAVSEDVVVVSLRRRHMQKILAAMKGKHGKDAEESREILALAMRRLDQRPKR